MPRETANRVGAWIGDNLWAILCAVFAVYGGIQTGLNENSRRADELNFEVQSLERRVELQEKMAAAYVVGEKRNREFHNCLVRHFDSMRNNVAPPPCQLEAPGQ